jgi:hypothetical protein
MRAYYEIEAEISASHQLNINLPDNIPPGKAKIAIVYEIVEADFNKNARMVDFLNSLSDNPTVGLNREEIQAYIDQEHQGWDN